MPLSPQDKLALVESIIRDAPDRGSAHVTTDENLEWHGRVLSLAEFCDLTTQHTLTSASNRTLGSEFFRAGGFAEMMVTLRRIRHSLLIQLGGPPNLAVTAGAVFEYFDAIRKVLAEAREDLLFVDPYLDAEFVSRYLAPLEHRPTVRLLTRERIASLLPAAEALTAQSGLQIHIRAAGGLHDRYVIVDRTSCFQSGASFKDGAKRAPTTLTQVVDLFPQLLATYEAAWNAGDVHLPRN